MRPVPVFFSAPLPALCALTRGVRASLSTLPAAPPARAQAKLAEEAERYEDMVTNVKALAELNVQVRRLAAAFFRAHPHFSPGRCAAGARPRPAPAASRRAAERRGAQPAVGGV